jgi:hypothetical protein
MVDWKAAAPARFVLEDCFLVAINTIAARPVLQTDVKWALYPKGAASERQFSCGSITTRKKNPCRLITAAAQLMGEDSQPLGRAPSCLRFLRGAEHAELVFHGQGQFVYVSRVADRCQTLRLLTIIVILVAGSE